MLNPDAFSTDFTYLNLPDNARRAALDTFKQQGFFSLEHYNISSLGENRPLTANILAFTHLVHRTPEYSGLTVFNATNGYDDGNLVRNLAISTAPFHLLHRDGEFSFWTYSVKNDARVRERHIAYDQLGRFFREYEADLNPQRIINVKQGNDTFTIFHDINPLQLSLWATQVTGKRLVEHFGHAVQSLRKNINNHGAIGESEKGKLSTTLSIQLLGAIILGDTGVLGDRMRLNGPSLDELLQEASKQFERYFHYDDFKPYLPLAEEAYWILREVCYASFAPDMLRELYKKAYTREERRESGSYDTPLHLTRRIWKNIPIEYIAPQKRIIADMTCGWGSFLMAGHERLSGLTDMEGMTLRDHLYGNDDAPFTSQLAGLGLLLATSEDSWNVDQNNALEWPSLNTHQPMVIVGNPPFKANQTRDEKANQFLRHAIDQLAPGGYLAMIMPRSFVAGQSSTDLRKDFLEKCDLLELWELPTNVFPDATARSIVLFAQKQEEKSHHAVRIRTIQPDTYKIFQQESELVVTTSQLIANPSLWNEQSRKSRSSTNTYLMDYKTILAEDIWANIVTGQANLQEYAICFRGVFRGTPPVIEEHKRSIMPEKVKCLFKARNILKRPFSLDYSEAVEITYPDDLERPRKQHKSTFERSKVVVVYTQDPSWGQRTKVAIERNGYYISDDFWVLAPTPLAQEKLITHEVLAAVVSWDVSNAWVIEHMSSPSLRGRAMKTIPFPHDLNKNDCNLLTQAVLQIEDAAKSDQPPPLEATQTIDAILKRAYHLDEETFIRLRLVREWDSNPQISLDPPPISEKANWSLSGVVHSINAEQGTITLGMSGFDELQEVQIAPSMPGWMLRPNAAFYTKIPRGYIKNGIIDSDTADWGAFYPQHYTYLTEGELFAELADILHADDTHRV